MRVTAFGEQAERFSALLQPQQVYAISKGTLKRATARFNPFPATDLEMTLDKQAQVDHLPNDPLGSSLPRVTYKARTPRTPHGPPGAG